MRPIVLTIAGSDPSGGAGIQADLKTIEVNRGYAATVLTSVTAQNTCGVERALSLPADLIREQMESVFSDLRVAAVKTGMLGDLSVLRQIVESLRKYRPPHLVVDPVMLAHGGFRLLAEAALEPLKQELLPLAELITPNVPEAEVLIGRTIGTVEEAEAGGRELVRATGASVLVKGGHLRESPATDVLVTRYGSRVFKGEFLDTPHTHGTGCVYSAAIATHLAHGRALENAIERSKRFVTEALRHGLPIGARAGPTDPCFHWNRRSGVVAVGAGDGSGS